MKETAYLINTSRGPVVDERALAEALNEGEIAGAAVDVLSTEPPRADNPLLSARNCVITPHIAWATQAARGRLMKTVVDNLRAFMDGNPRNVVG
jgi:glycerate dehydrogenase